MTEQEQFEFAAKAVGIVVLKDINDKFIWDERNYDQSYYWNPRDDGADSFRLETELELDVVWYREYIKVRSCDERFWKLESFSDHNGDKDAARRAASFRVAVEIGKAMG